MTTSTGLLGTLLEGRYRVTAPIARGGMSTVFRGTDTRLDRPVAIKVMDPVFAANPEFLSRFAMEARAVARLSHPGLVSVYDQGREGSLVYLVMELVEGGTVRTLLRERGAMPAALALSVLEPVLAALSTAHRAGLVHRDVKPENVLIGRDGAVKVADFGLVRAMATAAHTSATADNVILGTVAYLAPEQVLSGDADPRSDVYSAGILLYELLTGRPPYHGDSALALAYRHVDNDVPAPGAVADGVPPEVDELVRRATRRDPRQRFHDAGQFLGEIIELRRRLGLRRVRVPVPTAGGDPSGADVVRSTRVLTTLTPRRPRSPGAGSTAPVAPVRRAASYRDVQRRSRLTVTVWATVVVMLAAAVGVGSWWLGSGRFTTVPQLSGLGAEQAVLALTQARLEGSLEDRYDNTVPSRTVIEADPRSGRRVERGSTVVLAVSLGRPTVPAVEPGTPAAVVEQEIEDAGLTPAAGPGRYDDRIAEGSLVGLEPAVGTTLAVGAEVTLRLSRGPAPVDVPDVVGALSADAESALRAAGLVPGSTATEYSAEVPGGQVIRTSPAAGAASVRGTPVDLVTSSALTVPDVSGQRPGEAEETLRTAGFEIDGTGLDSAASARVTATDPAAGALVDPADPGITLVVQATAVVPRLVGGTVDEARATVAGLGLEVNVNQLLPLGDSRVRSQNPAPGTELDRGSTVRITAFP